MRNLEILLKIVEMLKKNDQSITLEFLFKFVGSICETVIIALRDFFETS